MRINADWEVTADSRQWILTQWKDGVDAKTKQPKRVGYQTFHPTLEKALLFLLDESGKQEIRAEDLLRGWNKTVQEITDALKKVDTKKIRKRVRGQK